MTSTDNASSMAGNLDPISAMEMAEALDSAQDIMMSEIKTTTLEIQLELRTFGSERDLDSEAGIASPARPYNVTESFSTKPDTIPGTEKKLDYEIGSTAKWRCVSETPVECQVGRLTPNTASCLSNNTNGLNPRSDTINSKPRGERKSVSASGLDLKRRASSSNKRRRTSSRIEKWVQESSSLSILERAKTKQRPKSSRSHNGRVAGPIRRHSTTSKRTASDNISSGRNVNRTVTHKLRGAVIPGGAEARRSRGNPKTGNDGDKKKPNKRKYREALLKRSKKTKRENDEKVEEKSDKPTSYAYYMKLDPMTFPAPDDATLSAACSTKPGNSKRKKPRYAAPLQPVPPPGFDQPFTLQPIAYGYPIPTLESIPQPKPRNYMLLNIASALLCCFVFGILGIVKSTKVKQAVDEGELEKARDLSNKARRCGLIGFCFGFIINITIIVVVYLQFYYPGDMDD